MMGISRKRFKDKRWLSSDTMQFVLAVTAASRKQLSSLSWLIIFSSKGGFTRRDCALIVSVSLEAVSLLMILWNLGREITSNSSDNIFGEITSRNLSFSKALIILRQEGLLISPETNTLVSMTALSMFISAVGPYFFHDFFLGDWEFFDAGIDILKNPLPAQAQCFSFQFFGKPEFFFIGEFFYRRVYLMGIKFYGYLRT